MPIFSKKERTKGDLYRLIKDIERTFELHQDMNFDISNNRFHSCISALESRHQLLVNSNSSERKR